MARRGMLILLLAAAAPLASCNRAPAPAAKDAGRVVLGYDTVMKVGPYIILREHGYRVEPAAESIAVRSLRALGDGIRELEQKIAPGSDSAR